ncbi:MAG: DoxX family protein [Deltaproteobacteria bacterium]|nr:DoxX family protein [Deltaproteobacteria bacterium]
MTTHIDDAGRRMASPRPSIGRGMLVWTLRIALGAVLLYAGVLKAADPAVFAREVAGYQFFPTLAPLIAATLPTTELLLGLLLLILPSRSPWLRAAALATAAVFFMFLIAVTQVVVRGIDTRCGCFGADSGVVDMLSILRVAGFLVASVLLLLLTAPRHSKTNPSSP